MHICPHWFNNDLCVGGPQAITWLNAGLLTIGTAGTNCCEILIKTFSRKFIFAWEKFFILFRPQYVYPGEMCLRLQMYKFETQLGDDILGIHVNISLEWLLDSLIDGKSALVQVMAWHHYETSCYRNLCWPRFRTPYSITRPQWVSPLSSPHISALISGHLHID